MGQQSVKKKRKRKRVATTNRRTSVTKLSEADQADRRLLVDQSVSVVQVNMNFPATDAQLRSNSYVIEDTPSSVVKTVKKRASDSRTNEKDGEKTYVKRKSWSGET